MSATIEMPLKFDDSDEPSILRDADLINMFPLLKRSVEMANPNWETAGVKLETPIDINFNKATGDFLFKYARKYVVPDQDNGDPKIEEYKEASELSLDDLTRVIELASFMECTSFMHCVGFVIAKKLEETADVEKIAEYFGAKCIPESKIFAEEDGWVHPPKEVFENK